MQKLSTSYLPGCNLQGKHIVLLYLQTENFHNLESRSSEKSRREFISKQENKAHKPTDHLHGQGCGILKAPSNLVQPIPLYEILPYITQHEANPFQCSRRRSHKTLLYAYELLFTVTFTVQVSFEK